MKMPMQQMKMLQMKMLLSQKNLMLLSQKNLRREADCQRHPHGLYPQTFLMQERP